MSKSRRKETDVTKLLMSDFEVNLVKDSINNIRVKFHGPKDSPYEGGIWTVRVELPAEYPYKSPSIGFVNKIYHPNIDERSGTVCLDVINQTWSPMFDLVNIFETFLPQLLMYPNPTDPLNAEAARLQTKDPELYDEKIKAHVRIHALSDTPSPEDKATKTVCGYDRSESDSSPESTSDDGDESSSEDDEYFTVG